jgi:hypothetical protein
MLRLPAHKRRATYHPSHGRANEKKNWDEILTQKVCLVVSFQTLSEKGAVTGPAFGEPDSPSDSGFVARRAACSLPTRIVLPIPGRTVSLVDAIAIG